MIVTPRTVRLCALLLGVGALPVENPAMGSCDNPHLVSFSEAKTAIAGKVCEEYFAELGLMLAGEPEETDQQRCERLQGKGKMEYAERGMTCVIRIPLTEILAFEDRPAGTIFCRAEGDETGEVELRLTSPIADQRIEEHDRDFLYNWKISGEEKCKIGHRHPVEDLAKGAFDARPQDLRSLTEGLFSVSWKHLVGPEKVLDGHCVPHREDQ